MAVTREVVDLFLRELARRGLPTPDRQPDGSFRLELNNFTVTVNLDNIARDYAEDRDKDRFVRFVDQVVASASGHAVPDWAAAEVGLHFAAEPADSAFGDAIHDAVSDHVHRVLVYLMPEDRGILWVTPWMLKRWGKSRDEAEAVARGNLARLLEATPLQVEDNPDGRLGFFVTNSPLKASLLFAPNFKAVVGARLGWPLLMVLPLRDFAYVFRDEDRDLLPGVGSVVVREFKRGAYPITTEVFRLSDDGVEAIGRFEAPPDENDDGMKTIVYRGGIVRFRIPEHWEEEYEEEGGGTFYDEDEPGTLRLNVITFEAEENVGASADAILGRRAKEYGVPVERLDGGDARIRYRQGPDPDADDATTTWFWEVLNVLPPRHGRIALFSFSVEAEHADDADTAETVAMLDRELAKCVFAQELGE